MYQNVFIKRVQTTLLLIGLFIFPNVLLAQYQEVYLDPGKIIQPIGKSFSLAVMYDVSDNNNALPGIGIGVHYDSSNLVYQGYANLSPDFIATPLDKEETNERSDNDESTDRIILIAWSDLHSQSWPDDELPYKLVDLTFQRKSGLFSSINTSCQSVSAGYTCCSKSAVLNPLPSVSWTTSSKQILEQRCTVQATARLSCSTPHAVSIPIMISGTAEPGTDYYISEEFITIQPELTSQTINIDIYDDGLIEDNETIILTMETPVNVVLKEPFVQSITIVNNDKGHFTTPVVRTDRHVRYLITNFIIDKQPAEKDDELAVFDNDNVLCGRVIIENSATFLITVYADDLNTSEDEGANIGEELIFKIWDNSSQSELTLSEYMFIPEVYSGYQASPSVPPKWTGNDDIWGLKIEYSSIHFRFNVPSTTKFMSFYGDDFKIDGITAQSKDEIAVFDQQGNMCGHCVINHPGYFNFSVYGDEISSSEDEGAVLDEPLIFKIWDASEKIEITLEPSMFIQKQVFSASPIENVPPHFLGNNELRGMGIDALSGPGPFINGLKNDSQPKQCKHWQWYTRNTCLFRFAVDQHNSWQPSGSFTEGSSFSKCDSDGSWFLHVQAKDQEDNLSIVYTVSAELDNTKPYIVNLVDDPAPRQSKKWIWNANESDCTFRYAIDQNSEWSLTGEFSAITSASKDSSDGTWYLHVQARDQAGNLSEVETVSTTLDNTKPIITNLSNDSSPVRRKTWQWFSNEENCTFRYAIDQKSTWIPTGNISKTTTVSKNSGDGRWYLHVQAQDPAGNTSDVVNVFAVFDNTPPSIMGLTSDWTPVKSKGWKWSASEHCKFRFSIDQKSQCYSIPGTFNNISTAAINDGDGIWYLHVQAIDDIGLLSSIVTVFAKLDNTNPTILGLTDDSTPIQKKIWDLESNEECTFRFVIDQNELSKPEGPFLDIDQISKDSVDGQWYLHIEAKDLAGNFSSITTVSAIIDNTDPVFTSIWYEKLNKTFYWVANEYSKFRFAINQNRSWVPTGSFNYTTNISKNEGDGEWYLHLQAEDQAGNLSKVVSNMYILDNTKPVILGLSNDSNPVTQKDWFWYADEKCSFRFAVNQYESYAPTGNFEDLTSTTINKTNGKWFVHVQAKDEAGNMSDVRSVWATLDNTKPTVQLNNIPDKPVQRNTFFWEANENDCMFRFAINQEPSWIPEGIFTHTSSASINSGNGFYYFHLQAKDLAGNESSVYTEMFILDNTKPMINDLSDGSMPVHKKIWEWTSNEECTYRYAIDQNSYWYPAGDFSEISTATASRYRVDGKWYLHVQAMDSAGNTNEMDVFAVFDNSPPEITGIESCAIPVKRKTWEWSANEKCRFKFAVDQNKDLIPSGDFANVTQTTIQAGEGKWYLHVQAKDEIGYISSKTVFFYLDNTRPMITGLTDDPNPVKSKTWMLNANEECTFRFSIDQIQSLTPTGNFSQITSTTIINENGLWYLHVQAKDLAGNFSSVTTVYANLDNRSPVIKDFGYNVNTWHWNADEADCLFRYHVGPDSAWEPNGVFSNIISTNIYYLEGTYYLHVQAKDKAGNISKMITDSVTLEKPFVMFDKGSSYNYEDVTCVSLELKLSRMIDNEVTVAYKNIQDSAILDADYYLPDKLEALVESKHLTGYIHFEINDDHLIEDDEKVNFELTDAENARLDTNSSRLTHIYEIYDNDSPDVLVSQIESPITICENSQIKALSIVLNTEPKKSVKIKITSSYPELIKIDPCELVFEREDWNKIKDVHIIANEDDHYFGNKIIELSLSIETIDIYYSTINEPNIEIKYIDNDTPPNPPSVFGPDKALNHSNFDWTWNSGGGSNQYRYKINNNIWSTNTNNTEYSNIDRKNEGFHTIYVQEYNEYAEQWSGSGSHTVQIDTGAPCSVAHSNLNAESMTVEITYTYADIYDGEICKPAQIKESSGSGVQKVELWVAEPSESGNKPYSLYQTDEGSQINGYFEFPATIEGRYRIITRAIDAAGNYEMDTIPDPDQVKDTEIIFAEDFSGYAIIAVGAVGDEGLDAHTQSAKSIYKHLINRQFGIMHDIDDPLDHIKYLNICESIGVDAVQTATTYKSSLQDAITGWAYQKMKMLHGPLYIILIDHGAPDLFYLGKTTANVRSGELNEYISTLEINLQQNNIQKHEIVIVIDTCYSGSFINELSSAGRIIITSTAENEVSFRGPKTPSYGFVRDGAFFASNLFNELSKDQSLSESFVKATYLIEMLTNSNTIKACFPFYDTAAQHPLINDDNNNEGHNTIYIYGDGFASDNIKLGFTKTSKHPLEIDHVEINPNNILEQNEQYIDFKVFVSSEIDINLPPKVCVEIKKPDTTLPKYVDDYMQKILELQQICLEYNVNEKAYIGTYDELKDPGKYSFYFYVEDTDKIITYFDEISVYKNQRGNNPPSAFELKSPIDLNSPENSGRNEEELQQVIFEWENTYDPENDPFTYTLFLSKSIDFVDDPKLTIIKENLIYEEIIIQLPGNKSNSWDASDIYWKVRAIDEFGAYVDTQTYKFKTNYINSTSFTSKSPVVFVHVYDKISKLPIPGAEVKFDSDISTIDWTMRKSGRYIGRFHKTGHYQVTIQANGYETANESVDITENINIPFNFGISYSVQTGDLNRNKTIDLGDAIMCLQQLSDIQMNDYYYDKDALMGNVVGLRDAILILRQVGFSD